MFSCDYSALARLARIEACSISRAESSGDYLPIQDARDYALGVEAMRREDAQKLQDFKDDTSTRCSRSQAACVARMALSKPNEPRFS